MMKINFSVKPEESVHAFYLFFLIAGVQIGTGILGVPRYVFEHSRQDAWLSVFIAYVGMLVIVSIMFTILSRYPKSDIFGIQVDLFGNLFGKLLGVGYLLFLILELLTVLLNYINIVRVFIFPTFPVSVLSVILLTLIGYSVLGGFRVLVGAVFLFFIMSMWMVLLVYDPISRMESSHFFPMFDASFIDLLKGAQATSYTFFGLETLFVIMPFISSRHKAKHSVFLGVTFTAFFVLFTTIISIGYYSPNDISKMEWPVLSLFKSVSFSFLERFDYLIIAEWMMVIVPTGVIITWVILHGTERIFKIPKKKTWYTIAFILLILCIVIKTDEQIQKTNDLVSKIGFWIVFVYPIILLPIVLVKTKKKENKGVDNHEKAQ